MRKQNLYEDPSHAVVENILGGSCSQNSSDIPCGSCEHHFVIFLQPFDEEPWSVLAPGSALPGSHKAHSIIQVKSLDDVSHFFIFPMFSLL